MTGFAPRVVKNFFVDTSPDNVWSCHHDKEIALTDFFFTCTDDCTVTIECTNVSGDTIFILDDVSFTAGSGMAHSFNHPLPCGRQNSIYVVCSAGTVSGSLVGYEL